CSSAGTARSVCATPATPIPPVTCSTAPMRPRRCGSGAERRMAIIDLSHPLVTGMPVYPGDPGVRITPALELGEHGVAVTRLDLGSHAGTHLDAPSHSIAGGRSVDEIPLGLLVGPARILRASESARARIEEGD